MNNFGYQPASIFNFAIYFKNKFQLFLVVIIQYLFCIKFCLAVHPHIEIFVEPEGKASFCHIKIMRGNSKVCKHSINITYTEIAQKIFQVPEVMPDKKKPVIVYHIAGSIFILIECKKPSVSQLVQNEPEVFGDELAEAMPAASNELIPEPPSLQKRSYHIIIGSFENTTNAQQLSDKLKASGLDSRMIESTQGMYRVSMAAYVDKQEALQKLYKVREETNPGAWLLRI